MHFNFANVCISKKGIFNNDSHFLLIKTSMADCHYDDVEDGDGDGDIKYRA